MWTMFLSVVHDAESYFKIFGPQNYGLHFTHTSALTVHKFWSAFYSLTVGRYAGLHFTRSRACKPTCGQSELTDHIINVTVTIFKVLFVRPKFCI